MIQPGRVHVSDPAWRFDQGTSSEDKKFRGTVGDHYPTMSVTQICLMPLPPMERDSVLCLWRVAAMQPEALAVAKAWNYVVKAELVWAKMTPTGKRHFGMGHYVRGAHETCLIAVRGKVDVKSHSVRSLFEAPVPTTPDGKPWHSAKPDKFYEIVEEMFAGPYVETFARRRRPGWQCYGLELDGVAATPILYGPRDGAPEAT